MSIVASKGSIFIIILFSLIWYSIYVTVNAEKLKTFEFDNSTIGTINTKLREINWYITWKSTELWNKSKELYNKEINPTVNKATNEIKNTVDETKWKIDNVRKTLSWAEQTIDKAWKVIEKWKETIEWATEVFNDVERMNDWIIWTVNKDVVQ